MTVVAVRMANKEPFVLLADKEGERTIWCSWCERHHRAAYTVEDANVAICSRCLRKLDKQLKQEKP